MSAFAYRGGELFAEDVPLARIAAAVGTPCYVYSRAAIEAQWRSFDRAFGTQPHRVYYAVKANSNLAVLNLLARLGSGFDIVSGGELERVLRAGGDPARVVFSGVGKREDELRRALEVGIHCFNVESLPELERLSQLASAMGRRAPVALRVNPDVDAKTHPYISTGLRENKFGVDIALAQAWYRQAGNAPGIEVRGVACHIGSQLTTLEPFADAVARVARLVDMLAAEGVVLTHLDLGGGLGVSYRDETPPSPAAYVEALLRALPARLRGLEIGIEPGRAIVANAGVLLTRVEYLKHQPAKNFAVVDAAMNDLVRPALYDAWHGIAPLVLKESGAAPAATVYDIVGPVCESGDFIARERALALAPGDVLAVESAGAYGFVMSSNYNTRPRAAEVMVDDKEWHVVRARETLDQLMVGEVVLP